MIKKSLLMLLFIFNLKTCFGMNHVNDFATSAQEFWNNQTAVAKTALAAASLGMSTYILLNEYRNKSKNSLIRELTHRLETQSSEIQSIKKTSEETKSSLEQTKSVSEQTKIVVDFTTQHLYNSSYEKFSKLIERTEHNQQAGIKDVWLSHIFETLEEKFNKKHFTKNSTLKGMINTTVSNECGKLDVALDHVATMLFGKGKKYILYIEDEGHTEEEKELMQELSNTTLRESIIRLAKKNKGINKTASESSNSCKKEDNVKGSVSSAYSYFQSRFNPVEIRLKNLEDAVNNSRKKVETPSSDASAARSSVSDEIEKRFPSKVDRSALEKETDGNDSFLEERVAILEEEIKNKVNTEELSLVKDKVDLIKRVFFAKHTFNKLPKRDTETYKEDKTKYREELRDQAWNNISWNKHKYAREIAKDVYVKMEKEKTLRESQNYLLV